MEIQELKDKIENKIVAFSTITKDNKPHSIAVEVNKIIDDCILITNNQMKTTIKNIKNNPYVSLVFWKDDGGWRVDGKAEYYNSGKWLEFVKSLKENENFNPKGAILIKVENITELG
ncbi:MAG: pyridoxamine 5'-phosphate oxidase family protein [Candidatus Nanoarchaeia archaeon]|nr:pyridoxamine 5'-phosphate oxidase family protein [Candidatus Nanoarchaeia archaeon]MDD5740951.1 pyridoxamine 5'-phosphate oxidase family protein [Candidatus Nanoarchaeia archaeon]